MDTRLHEIIALSRKIIVQFFRSMFSTFSKTMDFLGGYLERNVDSKISEIFSCGSSFFWKKLPMCPMFLKFCSSSKEVSDLCNRRNCEMGLKSHSTVWLSTLKNKIHGSSFCNSSLVFSSLCDLLYGRPLGTPYSSKRCRQLGRRKLF